MSQPATDPAGVIQPASIPGAAAKLPGFVYFDLADSDGNPHSYQVQPHPATEGAEVMFALLALGAEPFASVVQSALSLEDAFVGKTAGEVLDLDLEGIVGRIEWGKVGADVKRSILSMPMGTLIRDVLRHTWRDGRQLGNDIHYNAAFTRNYFELMRAVWEVATANRFFPQLSTFEKGGGPPTIPG